MVDGTLKTLANPLSRNLLKICCCKNAIYDWYVLRFTLGRDCGPSAKAKSFNAYG